MCCLISMTILGILTFQKETVAASKIKISNKKVTLQFGKSKTIKLKGVSKKKVKWSSKNKKIATVSKNGKITAKKAGTTKVYAQIKGKKKKYPCTVTVKPVMSSKKITIDTEKTKKLTLKGASNVKWTVRDSSIASVKNGVVNGKIAGKTIIYAQHNGKGTKYTCEVTVNPVLSETSVEMKVGETKTITLKGGSEVLWTTADKSIATVKNGTITGKKAGETTIYAQHDGEGKKYACKVKVLAKDEEEKEDDSKLTVSLTASKTSIKAYESVPLTLKITGEDLLVKNKSANWYYEGDTKCGNVDANNNFVSNGLAGTIKIYYYIVGQTADGGFISARSETITITITSDYTYTIQPLSNFYNEDMYATGSIGHGNGAVYIKTTDNILRDVTVMVQDKKGNQVAGTTTADLKANRFKNLDDEYNNTCEVDYYGELENCWIGDGFTATAYTSNMNVPAGDYYLVLAKRLTQYGRVVGYETLAQTEIHIYDTSDEFEKWCDNFINTYTTKDMNVHEQMLKMVDYLNSYCFHTGVVWRTQDVGLGFLSGCVDSMSTPLLLCRFGEYIGYDTITCEYYPDCNLVVQHSEAAGVYNGVQYNYFVSNVASGGANAHLASKQDTLQSLIDTYKNQWIEE